MLDLAKQHADHLDVITVNPLEFHDVVTHTGLDWEHFPALALQIPQSRQMMLFTKEDINPEILGRFVAEGLGLAQPPQEEVFMDEGVVLDDSVETEEEDVSAKAEPRDEL